MIFDPSIVIETRRLILRYMKVEDSFDIYQNINHIKLGTSDNAIITSKGYVDDGLSDKITKDVNNLTNYTLTSDLIGKLYSGSTNGEIFNDYTNNQATGNYSHAEGYHTKATGNYSHSEGYSNTASGGNSHCEGGANTASAPCAHAEGTGTRAIESASHAEGQGTTASGYVSHAGGNYTYADQQYQTAIGTYNTQNNTNCLFVVGNGTSDNSRSDAFCVYNDGKLLINNGYKLYFGPIIFAFADNDTSYPPNNTKIKEISSIGFAYTYSNGGNDYININASNVPTGHTNNPSAFYLIYVRINGDNKCYGNTAYTTGFASGPIICYESLTNPLLTSLEKDSTNYYSSRLIKHWNASSYSTNFLATANFNFPNVNFIYCYTLS